MNAIVDNHEAPMVISSIMKQNCTERGRRIVEKGMDITAGSGISRGDRNYMASGYLGLPVAITVEGANVMTRSFQIIGQGLTRCHPHMLELIQSLQSDEAGKEEAMKVFQRQLKKVVGHGFENLGNSIGRGVVSTIKSAIRSPTAYKTAGGEKLVNYHEEQLLRLSANFAITADLCFTLGGKLKFEELLMGRLADVMGAIFLGYATLHHYESRKGVEGLEAVTEHAMLRLEVEAQEALKEACANFPGPLGGVASAIMYPACFPLGPLSMNYNLPRDELTKEVSGLFTKPSEVREMFTENIYTTSEGSKEAHQVSDLLRALPVVCNADDIAAKLRREKREPTEAEKTVLQEAVDLRDDLVQVDSFEKMGATENIPGYERPALVGTREMLASSECEFDSFERFLKKE